MTEKQEKADCNSGSSENEFQIPSVYRRPKGLKGLYYHPITQVIMLGLLCFMCPGARSQFCDG